MNNNFKVNGLTRLGIKRESTAREADAFTTLASEMLAICMALNVTNMIYIFQDLGNMVDKVEESLNVLMDAYRVYQDTQKHTESTTKLDLDTEPDDKTHQRLVLEAYHKYTCIAVSNYSGKYFNWCITTDGLPMNCMK